MGNGLQSYVLHLQHGHACDVRPPVSLPGASLDLHSIVTRQTLCLAQKPPQLLSVPLGFSLVSFIGVIVSSSSHTIYGETVWNPIELLNMFLNDSPSSATRFGVCYPIILTWS